MKRSLTKYNDGGKTKKPTKAKLYFTVDDLAKGENYVTPEYLKEVDKRRNDWNEFVEFLKKENVYGSEALDKSGAGLGYLKKWNKANPDKTFTEEDIKDVQYFSRKRKGAEGERVNDGVLGKVTSTFTFPDSRVNTYEMKDGKKVLVKSEDPNIGNYQYQADKINFNIASKNKADVSKLPIYNQNSVKEGVAFGQDKSVDELLKNEFKKRSLSGQSLSKPKEFVKPLVATENHPAVKEQLEGSYFDNNQKIVDYNTNLQQQKQAEIQQQIDTRSALQKKLDTSKGKDFTKEEALDYFLETGKILPQNKVQAKYTRNKDNQIVDAEGNLYKIKQEIKTPGKFEFKNYGKNVANIASEAIKDFSDFGGSKALAPAESMLDVIIRPILYESLATPLRLGQTIASPITGAIKSTKIKLPTKKTSIVTNEEFGMPSFQDDNSGLTQKREGGYIEYPNGGKVNSLEANIISNVIMNRNRDKNFVNRAYALGQNPGMFTLQDPENFGDVMSHKMAWGTDDAGQAYMFPTVMNPNNEAVKVPNQYADYISSEGYKKATGMEYAYGGTINNMKKRTLKRYTNGGPSTGSTVSNNITVGGQVAGAAAPLVGALIPDKNYTDSEGNDLGSRKSIGESTLEYGASGAAMGSMLGPVGTLVGAGLGAGYGAVKGWMEKDEMEKKQKEANFRIDQRNLSNRMNNNVNWGTPGVNTSTNMMFAQGGMVLDYDDPNANAELELQETFQMPDGTVGNVDGPSHEMGGIAVDLPEGTRIWSDKLKHNGKTFAKHTKPITNKIARLEKQIAKNPANSEAKENSIALLNDQLDYYFDTQETNKQNNEMKRTFKNGGMIKRADGSYSKRGLWDNIRANRGSGKKPTPEMLKQERKIRAQEKEMGGYIYAEGGINNPGFRALPEEVQQKILARMEMGGYMYPMGGRLMEDNMFAEGGKLPKDILQARLESHMSPEEADAYLDEYGKGGYTVRRSNDRKGKTHVVIGPDGTKKYFGDPNLGERGKSKYGKEAFYARHKKNLDKNPYFRAYAKATWEDGGMVGDEYAEGGIHIKPENKGKFTAYAKSHGKGVQEMARTVLANKENYSPTIVKRANFAHNAAKWKHEMGGLVKYELAGEIGNPDRVAVGAINPRTGQPYTVQEVASYTDTQGMLPTPFGKQYGGLDNQSRQLYGNYEQNFVIPTSNLKMDSVGAANMQKPSMVTRRSLNQIGSTPTLTMPQRAGTGNYGEFYLPKRGQAYTDAVVENSPITKEEIQQANTMGNFPTGVDNVETPGFFNKAGQFIQNNPGLIGQLGTAALSAGIQSGRVNRLARPRTLADVRLSDKIANPNLVDYSAERNAIDRAALNAMSDAQRGFGSSAAAQAFKNKARLNQLEGTGRSFQNQENTNAQIRNQFLNARNEAAMREAMMNNEIDKYNLENVYGYDTMTTAQKNAITAMLANTAGQTFGKQTEYANQLNQANILANQYDPSVINDMIKNGKLKMVDGKYVRARNGGTIKKRSFRK